MSEKKKDQEKSSIAFLSDFTIENLEKSAEMEVKPKLTIMLGIENAVNVIIMSEPYQVKIPKDKRIGDTEKIWMIDLEYTDIKHQCTIESKSFRFQLGVIMSKLEITEPTELIGVPIRVWKTLEQINTPTFKGKAEMYHVSIM